MYYDDAACTSCFFMDPSEGAPAGFNACYLLKKGLGANKKTGCKEASWDATHSVMCAIENQQASYTILSTIQIDIEAAAEAYG